MLLIIFLGLIAKSALVCGDCASGTADVDNFDPNSCARIWHLKQYTTNVIEDNVDCPTLSFTTPVESQSNATIKAYGRTTGVPMVVTVPVTWKPFGFSIPSGSSELYNGDYYVSSMKVPGFVILQHCAGQSNPVSYYVAYGAYPPDPQAVQDAQYALQAKNIDVTKLSTFPYAKCKPA